MATVFPMSVVIAKMPAEKKIGAVWWKEMQDGRKDINKGRKEGRKEGHEGRKEGKEGRRDMKEGRT
jgi:hypothetical protein